MLTDDDLKNLVNRADRIVNRANVRGDQEGVYGAVVMEYLIAGEELEKTREHLAKTRAEKREA